MTTTNTIKTNVNISRQTMDNGTVIAWPNTNHYRTRKARATALRTLSRETGLPVQHGLWVRIG